MSEQKICFISWSGGMDSTGLVTKKLSEGYDVHTVSFNYGQKHFVELERLQQNIQYFKSHNIKVDHTLITISNTFKKEHSTLMSGGEKVPEGYYEESNMLKTVVSNRNAIFFSHLYSLAHQYAYSNRTPVEISLGVHSGDHAIYPDCRPEFYDIMFKGASVGNYDSHLVTMSLPYLNDNKLVILQDALEACTILGLDFDTVFANTNTCYEPDEQGRSTGRTGADTERILAFHDLGRPDPVPYVAPWEEVLAFALQARESFENQFK